MKRSRCAVFGAILCVCMQAGAAVPVSAEQPRIYAPGGVALSGYDAVSYFTEARPVRGVPDYAIMWRGAIWYFASPESLMTFEMNPEAYAPQFGGYCAYAIAKGRTATAEPDAFILYNRRLYLMHNTDMVEEYGPQMSVIVPQAESNWPAALGAD